MELSNNKKIFKFIKITIAIVLIVVIFIFLHKWTLKIEREYHRDQLRNDVESILNNEGEQGLLNLAGVKVSDIYYGDSAVTLAISNNSSWDYTSYEKQNIDVYEKCNSSVVFVSNSSENKSNLVEYQSTTTTGSGIIISKDGEILTNAHVIVNEDNVIVTLVDGSSHSAKVIGLDRIDDVAILKIDVEDELVPIKFGRSNDLKIGQKVLAIGNPFGYDRTLTAGIISGLNRAVETADKAVIMGMIQTDAAINPGNSGGPLLNGKGEMVGMNTSIYKVESADGMNFAIPVDTILSLLPDLLTEGKVLRGWIDIIPVQMNKQLAKYANTTIEQGILVSQVVKDGEAEKSGLKGGNVKVNYGSSVIYLGGDIITKINGRTIRTYNDYYNALLTTKKGTKAKVTIVRGKEEIEKTVVLVERAEDINKVMNSGK